MRDGRGTALIVGAGIGGLSAALALRNRGWTVRVFEQAASARELGFGLALAPNAIAALRELGVADTVIGRGYQARKGELRRPDGRVIKRAELPPAALGGTTIVALRPALHGALLEALGPDTLTVGTRVTGFDIVGDRVTARLANGQTVDGDLLVGADGFGSMVRRTLHPSEGPPRPSGVVALRGGVHGALHHLGGNDAVYYMGRGIESIFVRASDTGMYWFLSLSETLLPPTLRDPAGILAAMSPQFDDTFRAITAATGDMRVDELADRDARPGWSRGPVTLLGDAAHPLLPHTGQGAAQAITDAVRLADHLSSGDIPNALRRYEQDRFPKTTALLAQGRRTARLAATTNPIACQLRELVIRAIPVTTFARFVVKINRRAGTDVGRA